jgi:hypothetical protein
MLLRLDDPIREKYIPHATFKNQSSRAVPLASHMFLLLELRPFALRIIAPVNISKKRPAS